MPTSDYVYLKNISGTVIKPVTDLAAINMTTVNGIAVEAVNGGTIGIVPGYIESCYYNEMVETGSAANPDSAYIDGGTMYTLLGGYTVSNDIPGENPSPYKVPSEYAVRAAIDAYVATGGTDIVPGVGISVAGGSISVAAGNGIEANDVLSGGVSVKADPAGGLSVGTSGVAVNTGAGIELSGNSVTVALKSSSGLDKSGGLGVVAGTAVDLTGGSVNVTMAAVDEVLTGKITGTTVCDAVEVVNPDNLRGALSVGQAVDVSCPVKFDRGTFTYDKTTTGDGTYLDTITWTKGSANNNCTVGWDNNPNSVFPKFADNLKYVYLMDVENPNASAIKFYVAPIANGTSAGYPYTKTNPALPDYDTDSTGAYYLVPAKSNGVNGKLRIALTFTSKLAYFSFPVANATTMIFKNVRQYEVTALTDEAIAYIAQLDNPDAFFRSIDAHSIKNKYLVKQDMVCPFIPIIGMTNSDLTIGAGLAYKMEITDDNDYNFTADTIPTNGYGWDSHLQLFVNDTAKIHFMPPLNLIDPLTPNAAHNITVKWRAGQANVYVDDTDVGYVVTVTAGTEEGSLYYGLTGSTSGYVVFARSTDGQIVTVPDNTSITKAVNIIGNGTENTVIGNSSIHLGVSNIQACTISGATAVGHDVIESNMFDCVITGCTPGDWGVVVTGANSVLKNCHITANTTGSRLIFVYGINSGNIIDCTIDNNTLENTGAVIQVYTGCTGYITNCIIVDNSKGLSVGSNAKAYISGSTFGTLQDITVGTRATASFSGTSIINSTVSGAGTVVVGGTVSGTGKFAQAGLKYGKITENNVVIDGLTFEGAPASGNYILTPGADCVATAKNCKFVGPDNVNIGFAGDANSTINLVDCLITGTTGRLGGIGNTSETDRGLAMNISGCTFSNVTGNLGVMQVQNGTLNVSDCLCVDYNDQVFHLRIGGAKLNITGTTFGTPEAGYCLRSSPNQPLDSTGVAYHLSIEDSIMNKVTVTGTAVTLNGTVRLDDEFSSATRISIIEGSTVYGAGWVEVTDKIYVDSSVDGASVTTIGITLKSPIDASAAYTVKLSGTTFTSASKIDGATRIQIPASTTVSFSGNTNAADTKILSAPVIMVGDTPAAGTTATLEYGTNNTSALAGLGTFIKQDGSNDFSTGITNVTTADGLGTALGGPNRWVKVSNGLATSASYPNGATVTDKRIITNEYEPVFAGTYTVSNGATMVVNETTKTTTISSGTIVMSNLEIPKGATVITRGGIAIGTGITSVTGNGTLNFANNKCQVEANKKIYVSGANIVSGGNGTTGVGAFNLNKGVGEFIDCTISGCFATFASVLNVANAGASATFTRCVIEDNYGGSPNICFMMDGINQLEFCDCRLGAGQGVYFGEEVTTGGITLAGHMIMKNVIVPRISTYTGKVTISSGTTLDFTGNQNAIPINTFGGNVTIDGGMTVLYDHDASNNQLASAKSYAITGATFTVPSLGNANVVNLGQTNVIVHTGDTTYANGCTITGGYAQYGGAFLVSGTLSLASCTLSGNVATGNAGVHINQQAGACTLSSCSFDADGSDKTNIHCQAGTMEIIGCTLSGTATYQLTAYTGSAVVTATDTNIAGTVRINSGKVTLSGSTVNTVQFSGTGSATLAGNNTIGSIARVGTAGGNVFISSGAAISLTSSIVPGGGITVLEGGCTVNGNAIAAGTYTSIDSNGSGTLA